MASGGTPQFDDHRLGATDREIPLATAGEHRAIGLALARQCRRRLEIVSRSLDPRVYDSAELAEAVKQLAIGHRNARIRLLVADPEPLIHDGHRLLDLAGRLPSFIELRVLAVEDRDFNEAFLIADGSGYVHRSQAERYEGTANFNHRSKARELARRFDALWDMAEPDPNLRRMLL